MDRQYLKNIKFLSFLFSMPLMVFLVFIMAFSAAVATFIENDFGTQAARAAVYNARWFEVLLLLIVINLTGNMIRWRTWKKAKLSIFIFHIAFLLIFLGSGITRYLSYEGSMHIREGSSSDRILSSLTYLHILTDDGSTIKEVNRAVNFVAGRKNNFGTKIKTGGEDIYIKLVDFMPKRGDLKGDILQMEISRGDKKETLHIIGNRNEPGEAFKLSSGGVDISISYGQRWIKLPFSIYLSDFQLERYPGSNSPSSYASEVVLRDTEMGEEVSYRIFMNNILNYRGYRFFQSSYDNDEQGTLLSVNHDAMGTGVTYIGYFLMTLGMILALFAPGSRFRKLAAPGSRAAAGIALLLLGLLPVQGVKAVGIQGNISREQAKQISTILVQDQGGRIKPLQTMASDVARKVMKNESLGEHNAVQVVMGMYLFPEYWQGVPMIKVQNQEIGKILGIRGKYASYADFFDMSRGAGYKLAMPVQKAYRKKPGERSRFDQELMKVDERLNICYMVYAGDMLRVFPVENDSGNKWYAPGDIPPGTVSEDSAYLVDVHIRYREALIKGDMEESAGILEEIHSYQEVKAGELYPPARQINMEIFYNRAGIFEKLSVFYALTGFILLILVLVNIMKDNKALRGFTRVAVTLLGFGFLMHSFGLGIRWYISGHAPWSNGYESMIYIAWAAMLSGLIFARRSGFTLVAASLMAALSLLVAHLSWMNPEITNLVPVLKSYWLTIHVSIITASYGFLGTSMILGLFSLFLYSAKTSGNKDELQKHIISISEINEMSMVLGLYFVSIGTFLGAVWANESWGRYWGWDPKETWALITVLVYLIIVHLRFVPGLKGYFAFNLASVIGFFSVLMTYFGVNYYLAGLHSYAQGDSVPIPAFVYYTLISLAILVLYAWFNERSLSRDESLSGSR